MNKLHVLTLSALLGVTPVAMAASASLNQFTLRVMPVLVQVNAQGRVTNLSPSMELTPQLARLLRSNVDELISGPAVAHGKPIASQFVLNMALQATPRDQGDYAAQFIYVSSSPVPSGSWYWVHIDGHRLALAERGAQRNIGRTPRQWMQRAYPAHNPAPAVRPQNVINAMPAPVATTTPTTHAQ
ncbi:MAG: hypothetical protein ABI300_03215 [Rhodanobacter sp.]